mgnify:FL=1
MIKVAIVDDEQTICDKIKNILLKFDDIRTYTYNSLSLLDQKYDFILLDIEMPDYDGIEYSKKHLDQKIIFISSYDTRYKQAYGPNIYGYITKDNLETEIIENVSKMIKLIENDDILIFKVNGQEISIRLSEIIYFMYLGDKNIALVYENSQMIVKNQTIKSVMENLNDDFIMIDRGVVINKNRIDRICDEGIYLKGVNCLFCVSRRKKKEVLKAYYETK